MEKGSPLMAQYHVKAHTDNEPRYCAYLYCGLYDLEAEGTIKLDFKHGFSFVPREIYCTLLEVREHTTGERRIIAVDWRDNAHVLCTHKLAACDLYYKRNYISEITEPACPPEHRHKLRPLGATLIMRGARERPNWVIWNQGLWRDEKPWRRKSPREIIRSLYRLWKQPEVVRSRSRQEIFEADSLNGAQNRVLFQTRAFNPESSAFPEDTQAITEERAQYIRALKAALGDQFVGGFVPDAYARQHYPDCVAPEKLGQHAYMQLVKSCRICIYSRGLRDSPANKLGEYLAGSRCIVSQRFKTELSTPLEEGRDVLFFDTAEELVEKCRLLLNDEELQQRLSTGARTYYQQHVKPRQRVLQIFREAFATEPSLETRAVGVEA
jgi:hypothetical protein